MPTRANKHGGAAERKFYPAFDGGLNLAAPAESIAPNELREAVNVEFSPATGSLRVRGGLVWTGGLGAEVLDVVPVPGTRGFLMKTRTGLKFFRWNCTWPVAGALTGDGPMSAAPWGDHGLLVASGGKLQLFDTRLSEGLPLTTLSRSPQNCRQVFVREGRAVVVTTNDGDSNVDTLRFSAVGDCERWENDPNDDSSGQFLEVGYKDGMDINAVVPLSRDLILFKSPPGEPEKGTIWRLAGEFPNWQLLEAAHNVGTFGQGTARAVGNDVFFLTPSGLASLSTVTSYGDVRTAWPDRKVSPVLMTRLNETARLWSVPVKEQLWVLPREGTKEVWVFDYARGIWTAFEFPEVPVAAWAQDVKLYVFFGSELYHLHDGYEQDDMIEAQGEKPPRTPQKGQSKPVEIKARMRLGTLLKAGQTLIKGVFATFDATPGSGAELDVGGFKMPLRAGGGPIYIWNPPSDVIPACDDDRPLFPTGGVMRATRRCLVREWAVMPVVEAGGGFALDTMGMEIVEVEG